MTASLPSALALLLLTAAPLLPEQLLQNGDFVETDAAGLSKSWQLVAFRDSPKPQVERVAEDGRTACRLTFAEDAPAWCVSFSQPLPQLDVEGSLVVRFAIKPQPAKPRMLSVNLSATPGCSLPCARHFLGDLRQGEWQEVEARFPLRGMKATGSVVEFIAERAFTAGDRVSLTDVHVEQEEPPPLVLRLTAPVSGVVFTDAPSQALAGIVRVSRKPAGRQVRLSLLSAATLQEPVSIQVFTATYPRTPWRLDLAAAPAGKYEVRAELIDDAGAVTQSERQVCWRLQPTPTTTRVVGGNVCVGSEPILLLGTYHVSDWAVAATNAESRRIGAPERTRDELLGGLARQGFNAFLYTSRVPPPAFLEAAGRHGLHVIPAVAGIGREWGGAPLSEELAPWTDDPRLFGWGGRDEPSPTTTDSASQVYRGLKSLAPRKLVFTSFCAADALDFFEGENTAADLILMDIYRVRAADSDLSEVGSQVRRAVQYVREHGSLAVGVAPQAFIYGGPEPTPEQLRAQLYLGVVNGARAFFLYSYTREG